TLVGLTSHHRITINPPIRLVLVRASLALGEASRYTQWQNLRGAGGREVERRDLGLGKCDQDPLRWCLGRSWVVLEGQSGKIAGEVVNQHQRTLVTSGSRSQCRFYIVYFILPTYPLRALAPRELN